MNKTRSSSPLMGAKAKKALKKNLKKASAQLMLSRHKNEFSVDFLLCLLSGGGAVPALAQLVSSSYHTAISSSPSLGRPPQHDDSSMNRTRSSSPLMGAKAKKALKKNMKKASTQLTLSRRKNESSVDFLTGKSKHYGFIEFENPEVAKVVAEEMNNYLLFEHTLQIHPVPLERVHPKLWRGVSRRFIPLNWKEISRKQHNKERTAGEHQKMVRGILKRDEKRRKRIKDAGIDYECPELVGLQPEAKKIKFDDEEEEE